MVHSGCLKAGELLLGTLGGVDLDSSDRKGEETTCPSSNHDPVLELNTTSQAENEDDDYNYKYLIKISIVTSYLHNYYYV